MLPGVINLRAKISRERAIGDLPGKWCESGERASS